MLDKSKKSFTAGVTKVKWIASFLAERTKAETVIAKLFYERNRLENRVEDLYRNIGKRVLELEGKGSKDLLHDSLISNSINELKNVKVAADDCKMKADKLRRQQSND